MGKVSDRFLDATVYRRALGRWEEAARGADATPPNVLRRQSQRARELRTHLDRLIHKADERLARPAIGSTNFPKPHNADWSWRPKAWRGRLPVRGLSSVPTRAPLDDEITLFHDCSRAEINLRQRRNQSSNDLAPYGLAVEVFSFEGSFLSLVLDLPQEAVAGLKKSHILQINTVIEKERPLEVFARLNIEHGPNTEQMLRGFSAEASDISVEFDLAYADLNEKRISKAWVDLIFETPQMNQITLRDLTFSRRPRAQI